MYLTPRYCPFALVVMLLTPGALGAQAPPASPTSPQSTTTPPTATISVTVTGTTPLDGGQMPVIRIPAAVQTASDREIDRSGGLTLPDFMNRRMNAVHVNDVQSNPFQPDVNYRGYTASPLLGTPQGLSVYMDGVRLNQPFGEVVSWDLIPRRAIAATTLMPGSNPMFGLNTLGGALALRTKDGSSHAGTAMEVSYGSDSQRTFEFEHGGQLAAKSMHWFVSGNLFHEDGWRDDSPSDVRQIFGKLGWRRPGGEVALSVGHADNQLSGNGLQEYRMLASDSASVYTKPDITNNRSTMLNVTMTRRFDQRASFLVNGYYRDLRTDTFNGDINEESLDQSVYQPNAVERAALAAAGYGPIPASGLDASNTPFPSLPCIANVLLNDEPSEKCNGLINRTATTQHNGGVSGEFTRRDAVGGRENLFVAGAAFDRSTVAFAQSTELGYINPDRSITGLNAYGDGGLTGGEADGEPYDTRVDLDGDVTTWSLYATDTLPVSDRIHLTFSGRYNHTIIDNRDLIRPDGGAGSLNGRHAFSRFNPAAGATFALPRQTRLYAGYTEGSRAATSIELGCADPETPCRLPNAMAGDPPLAQVVTRTVEGGASGAIGRLQWNAGVFRAENRDDILFVTAERTGFGYFRNFGRTRRQGIELGARADISRVTVGTGYTFLRATFESDETVNGESNSANDAAEEGERGLEGAIEIRRGDRMPMIPRHLFKAFADVQVTNRLTMDVNLIASSSIYARGNENNLHEPDGTYYLGDGTADGYAVFNLGARYALSDRFQLIGQINNLFDQEYASSAQLGVVGFTEAGSFLARPFPPVNGEFPLAHSTFVGPGAPRRAWIGLRFRL
jgi:outer membrane receptor protein involved in Fe transport